MLIVEVIFASNVKIQKLRNSPSQVVHVDKLKVCLGDIPKSWLPVDMDDNTATASENEPEDRENQDDGVVDDHPNELDDALIVDESAGPSSDQSDDKLQTEMVTTTEDSRSSSLRTPPETKLQSRKK